MGDDVPVRAVGRAVEILLALSHGPRSLGWIAERTDLSKATAHRLLASLNHGQLVIQDRETSEYQLGPGCLLIADAVMRGLGGLGVVSRPTLERLHEDTKETITLHVRAATQRICVEELVSPRAVRYTAGVGAVHPIHTGSAGKLLLAFADEDERNRLLGHLDLVQLTDSTITNRSKLEKELATIRHQGYAMSRGERVEGAAAISAPVFGGDHSILAAVSILGPESRLGDSVLRELRPLLVDAAEEISERITVADEQPAEEGGSRG